MAPETATPARGIVWGREGEAKAEGTSRRGEAGGCLNVPAPRPPSQNRFGQSGVREGGWNNGSPMPGRSSEGPQTP